MTDLPPDPTIDHSDDPIRWRTRHPIGFASIKRQEPSRG